MMRPALLVAALAALLAAHCIVARETIDLSPTLPAPPASLPLPGRQPLNITATWYDPKYALCVQPYTWRQLLQGYKDGTLTFRSGGMGGMLEKGGYEVWLCLKDHYCAIDHNNPFFCFAYHETKKEWTPWGSNADLQLVRLQSHAATSASGGPVSSLAGGQKIQFVPGSDLTLQWSSLQHNEVFVMEGPYRGRVKVRIQCPIVESEPRKKRVCIQTLPGAMGAGSGPGSANEPDKIFQTFELLVNGVQVHSEDEFPTVLEPGSVFSDGQMPPRGSITLSSVRVPPFQMTARLEQAFYRGNSMFSVGNTLVVSNKYTRQVDIYKSYRNGMISSDSDSLTTLSGGGEDTSDSIWGGHHVVIGELVIHYGGYPGRVDGLDWWSWSTSSTPSPKIDIYDTTHLNTSTAIASEACREETVVSASGSGLAAFVCGHVTESASTIDIFIASSRLWIVSHRSASALLRGSPLPRDYAGQSGQDGQYGTNAHLACVTGKVILTYVRPGEKGVSVEVFSGVDGSIMSESLLRSAGPVISPIGRRMHVDVPSLNDLRQNHRHGEDMYPSQRETRLMNDNHHDDTSHVPTTFDSTVPAYANIYRTRNNKNNSGEDNRQETMNRDGRFRQRQFQTKGRPPMNRNKDLSHVTVRGTSEFMLSTNPLRWKLSIVGDGDGVFVFAGVACVDNFWNDAKLLVPVVCSVDVHTLDVHTGTFSTSPLPLNMSDNIFEIGSVGGETVVVDAVNMSNSFWRPSSQVAWKRVPTPPPTFSAIPFEGTGISWPANVSVLPHVRATSKESVLQQSQYEIHFVTEVRLQQECVPLLLVHPRPGNSVFRTCQVEGWSGTETSDTRYWSSHDWSGKDYKVSFYWETLSFNVVTGVWSHPTVVPKKGARHVTDNGGWSHNIRRVVPSLMSSVKVGNKLLMVWQNTTFGDFAELIIWDVWSETWSAPVPLTDRSVVNTDYFSWFLYATGDSAVICQAKRSYSWSSTWEETSCTNVDSAGVLQSASAVIEVSTDTFSMTPVEVPFFFSHWRPLTLCLHLGCYWKCDWRCVLSRPDPSYVGMSCESD